MSTEPNELNSLESALTRLAPTASRLDRDGLMFAAGRASVPRRLLIAACGFALASSALAGFLLLRPPQLVERIVVVNVPAPVPSPDSHGTAVAADSEPVEVISFRDPDAGPSPNPLLEMRRQLLSRGDLVPLAHPAKAAPAPPPRPLEKDLDLPPGSLDGIEPGHRSSSFGPW